MQYLYVRNPPDADFYTYCVATSDDTREYGYYWQCGDTIEEVFAANEYSSFRRNGIVCTTFAQLRAALLLSSIEYSAETHPEYFI